MIEVQASELGNVVLCRFSGHRFKWFMTDLSIYLRKKTKMQSEKKKGRGGENSGPAIHSASKLFWKKQAVAFPKQAENDISLSQNPFQGTCVLFIFLVSNSEAMVLTLWLARLIAYISLLRQAIAENAPLCSLPLKSSSSRALHYSFFFLTLKNYLFVHAKRHVDY